MMDYPVVHSRFSFPLAEKTDRGDSFFCLCFFHWNGQGLHYSVPDIRFTEWCNTPIKLWRIGRVPSGSCALIGQTPSFSSALTGWTPLGFVIWFAQPSAFICSDSNICKVWSVHTLVRTVSHSSAAVVWELLLHSWKSSPVRRETRKWQRWLVVTLQHTRRSCQLRSSWHIIQHWLKIQKLKYFSDVILRFHSFADV